MGKKNPPLDPEAAALLKQQKDDEAAIIAAARELPEDTEDLLRKLEAVQGERYQWTSDKGIHNIEYESLRDAAAEVLRDGPRYFIDHDGIKMVAVRQQSQPVVVDLKILGELDPALLDVVAPRKIDMEKFKRNVANGKIPSKVFVRHASVTENAAHVKFIRADQTAED